MNDFLKKNYDVGLPGNIERGPAMSATAMSQAEGWDQKDLEMKTVWDMGALGQRCVVMVPDTGVYNHVDIPAPFDTYNATPEGATDRNNHSTWICGSIGAVNNDIGYRGYASESHLVPIKVLRDSGSGSGADIEKAMRWALNWWTTHPRRPARLGGTGEFLTCFYSMSYGGGGYSASEFRLFQDMIKAGIVPCASSGNESRSAPSHPAAYQGVRKHGAYGQGRKQASFTNYGPWTDAVGPGVNVPSTVNQREWAAFSGTSMSNPIIVATMANYVSAHPNDTWVHDTYGLAEVMAEHMQNLPGNWDGRGVFLPAKAITRFKHFIF